MTTPSTTNRFGQDPTKFSELEVDEIIEELWAIVEDRVASDFAKVQAIIDRLPVVIKEGSDVPVVATVATAIVLPGLSASSSTVEVDVEIGGYVTVIEVPYEDVVEAQS